MTVETETQDIVEPAATENTGAESQENQEQQTEGEQGKQESETQEPEKPKKSRAQERIEQTTRENAELKRQLAEIQAQKNSTTPASRPHVDDFETYEEFEDSLEKWRIGEAVRILEEKQSKSMQEKTQSEKAVEFESAFAEVEAEGVDVNSYFQKAEQLPPLPVQLSEFGLSAKDTILLAKELLDDEKTYLELANMSQVQAIGKIAVIIEGKKSKTTPPVSKAPPPIKPVSANAPASRDPEKMSTDEWMKQRNEEIKNRK